MKRAVFKEDCFQHEVGDPGIDHLPCFNIRSQLAFPCNDDQGPGFCLSHLLAGLDNHVETGGYRITHFQFPKQESSSPVLYYPGVSQHKQELPDFWLENDYQCDHTNADKLTQYLAEQLHLKSLDYFPNDINGNDPDKDPDRCGPFDEVINLVQKESKKENVDHIGDPEVK